MRAAVLRVSSVLAIAAMSLALAATAGAQSLQGGLRGVVKDPQGVIPGVTVTLVNEKTASRATRRPTASANTRSPPSNPAPTRSERPFPASRRSSARASASARSSSSSLDIDARSRRARGDDHGHRRIAADRHDQRVDRRRARHQVARVDSERRPQRVPDGEPVPTVQTSGNAHWNRMQDQVGNSRDVDGRRRASAPTTTWSTASRSPTCRTAPRPTRPSKRCRT